LSKVVVKYHPEFVVEKRGPLSIQVVRTLTAELLPKIVPEPDHLFELPDCEIIKDEKKIKVARVKMEIESRLKTVYVKRYNALSWWYRFGTLFESSRALRSLSGAAILGESGIQTARPLAAVEFRSWGMLNRCFFLSEEIEGGKTTGAYWRQDLLTVRGKEGMHGRRRFMRAMGELFRSLHKQGIYHNDLKDANIVVRADSNGGVERFYLVDLEGIRRYRRLNRRRQIKNLVQLNLSLGAYLRPTDKLRFLASYLGPLYASRIHKRNWVASVTGQSNRVGSQPKTKISS
jgi:serine/threonine protein kinase